LTSCRGQETRRSQHFARASAVCQAIGCQQLPHSRCSQLYLHLPLPQCRCSECETTQSILQSAELLLMSDEIREMMASRSCLLQRAAECGFACRGSLENSRPDRDRLFILMSLSFCSEACMSSRYSLHCGTCRKRIHDQRSNNKLFHYLRCRKQTRSDVRTNFLGWRWTPHPFPGALRHPGSASGALRAHRQFTGNAWQRLFSTVSFRETTLLFSTVSFQETTLLFRPPGPPRWRKP